jgi:hypothetical protein
MEIGPSLCCPPFLPALDEETAVGKPIIMPISTIEMSGITSILDLQGLVVIV